MFKKQCTKLSLFCCGLIYDSTKAFLCVKYAFVCIISGYLDDEVLHE